MTDCSLCPALCASRRQIVQFTSSTGGILAIGEAPGREEDLAGEGFVGSAGQKLDALFLEHGITREQYGRANVVKCRPEGNRRPVRAEIDRCLPNLAEFLLEMSPRVIVAVGAWPTKALYGPGLLNVRITESRASNGRPSLDSAHPALREVVSP